MKWEFDN